MADDLGERCEELAHALLAPLVLGGPMHLVRPFGAHLGLRLGIGREIVDLDLRSRLDVARVRRARLLAPVDALPPLDESDWATLAALNDLLQLTNQHLAGPFTRGRYARMAANLRWLCERIPAPRDIEGALSRHATFGRVLELVRTDSKVSWWTGSASFRGEPPPRRLLAWRELRRVQVDATRVPIAEMPEGLRGVTTDDFQELLALWLTRSPLTDLGSVTRKAPSFAWSASTLSLVASAPGRALAYRAICRLHKPGEAPALLLKAAKQIPEKYEEARDIAQRFAAEVSLGLKAIGERASAAG